MFKIRPATPSMLLTILDQEIFPEDSVYNKRTPGTKWWTICKGNYAVGFCGVRLMTSDGYAILTRAGLKDSARGKGLQCRMIRVREAYARKAGMKLMITYVHPENLASANNLIRCGYTLYTPQYYWGFKDALYFRKDL